MKIVTYNLRCVWDGDGINGFIHRMGMTWDKINQEKPDIVCFQEVIPKTLEALKYIMPEYIFAGQGRNHDCGGEGLYTAIRKDTVDLIGLDTFWISPEPHEPESKFTDQSTYPRICVMTLLREKQSGLTFRIYNLHLDLIEAARLEGIKCVWNQVQQNNTKRYLPYVILGDFNATPDEKCIALCKETGALYDVTESIAYTFHDFGRGVDDRPGSKLDYIFVSREFTDRVIDVTVWEDNLNGIYLSDHYPVAVEI